MTREEALKILDTIPTISEQVDALEMAIEALKTQPCEDCISRQTIKEQMIKYGFHAPDMTVTEFVEDLPSVTPKAEHEAILDKIRTEINQLPFYRAKFADGDSAIHINKEKALHIIDKYKTERE